MDIAIPLLKEYFKSLASICGRRAKFVSHLVGNHNIGFLTWRLIFFLFRCVILKCGLQGLKRTFCIRSTFTQNAMFCHTIFLLDVEKK